MKLILFYDEWKKLQNFTIEYINQKITFQVAKKNEFASRSQIKSAKK